MRENDTIVRVGGATIATPYNLRLDELDPWLRDLIGSAGFDAICVRAVGGSTWCYWIEGSPIPPMPPIAPSVRYSYSGSRERPRETLIRYAVVGPSAEVRVTSSVALETLWQEGQAVLKNPGYTALALRWAGSLDIAWYWVDGTSDPTENLPPADHDPSLDESGRFNTTEPNQEEGNPMSNATSAPERRQELRRAVLDYNTTDYAKDSFLNHLEVSDFADADDVEEVNNVFRQHVMDYDGGCTESKVAFLRDNGITSDRRLFVLLEVTVPEHTRPADVAHSVRDAVAADRDHVCLLNWESTQDSDTSYTLTEDSGG